MRDTYHHGDLKKQLILVGIDIINQEGLEGLSLRKAAERCGVSHGAPYSHFKNKEEYLKNINAFVEDAFSEALMEAEMNNNGDERGRMARMARAYVGFFCQHPSFYSFYTKYAEFRIDIHETSIDCVGAKPFYIFKNAAEQFLNMKGMPKEKQAAQIIQMWALVQGITMFAVMPSIHNDLKWEEYTEKLLMNKED